MKETGIQLVQSSNIDELLRGGWLKRAIHNHAPRNDLRELSVEVRLECGLTIKDMIELGGYDHAVHPEIDYGCTCENRGKSGTIKLYPVCRGRQVLSDEIAEEMEKEGLRKANLLEFLAFGAACPDFQRKFWVTTLDSCEQISEEFAIHPILREWNGERDFSYFFLEVVWPSSMYFLATDK